MKVLTALPPAWREISGPPNFIEYSSERSSPLTTFSSGLQNATILSLVSSSVGISTRTTSPSPQSSSRETRHWDGVRNGLPDLQNGGTRYHAVLNRIRQCAWFYEKL